MKARTFTPGTGPSSDQNKFAPAMPMPAFRQDRSADPVPGAVGDLEPAAVELAPVRAGAEQSPVDAGASHVPGERLMQIIDAHLIDANTLAPREVYTAKMILDRAEDLRHQGQHDPIHIIPNPDFPGRFIIADGWTRVQACTTHGVLGERLLAEVHPGLTLLEAAWFGYNQNECRELHCDLDRAMFYEKLILAGQTAAEVARQAKLSKTMMSFYRAYARLPVEVLDIIRENPQKFGATAAYQLSRLNEVCGLRKAVALAGKFAAEEQPVRWLVNQATAQMNPTAHKPAVPLKHIRFANGFFKQRNDDFEVAISVPPDQQEAFSLALEALLKTVAVPAPEPTA